MKNDILDAVGMLAIIVLPVALITAWLTHIITCIGEEAWVLLIAGAIMFPIGIIHGIGIWFGAF